MTIRRVNCPACKAVANVPVTMTNIKCPSCGQVWNINQPQAAAPAAAPGGESQSADHAHHAVIFAGVAAAVVLLAIVGISLVLFLPGKKEPAEKNSGRQEINPAAASTNVAAADAPPSYREVDLPESTRQKLYWDYRQMAASSIEKKVMIPKDSPVRTSLDGMLKQTVEREIKHFSLLYNISEDDVMQVVAEGDAKQWPGSPKPKQPAAAH